MVRPKQQRHVSAVPKVTYFKPRGIPMAHLSEVRLSVEGLEAVRLADLEGLPCCRAAACMGISRHTFGRVLNEARRTIAAALVQGQALRIEGGAWFFGEAATAPCGHGLGDSPPDKPTNDQARPVPDWEIPTDKENL